MEEACHKLSAALFMILVAGTPVSGAAFQQNSSQALRFWIDEYAFSDGETTILREEIENAGNTVATVTGETKARFLSVKGYYAPEQWDVYWTGRQGCIQALPYALPGHKISCVPGLHELTMKDRLVARLTQFYGEGAFDFIPRSYLLPTQYWLWRLWLAAQEPQRRGEMWVLKEERHRGRGVHVMPLAQAVREAKSRREQGNYGVVQAYIDNQMTVASRKFYVRLWAVVTSSFPLRAYLFDGGVVVFGNSAGSSSSGGSGKPAATEDLIVNLWALGRATEAAPWSVADFRSYVDNLSGSRAVFDRLWRDMQRALGLTFAAGVPSMRFSAASFPVAAASATFELVGVDFIVDDAMKPWLLEVNAVPSLARKVINCESQPGGCAADGEAESVFDVEKERLVHSLFRVLRATAGTGVGGPGSAAAAAAAPGVPPPLTLAELMKRWRSNATDLAALNSTNSTAKSSMLADIGWHSPGNTKPAAADGDGAASSSARSLSNSGRELRSVEESPDTAQQGLSPPGAAGADRELQTAHPEQTKAANGKDQPAPAEPPLPHIHDVTRSQSVAAASSLNKFVPLEHRTIAAGRDAGDDEAADAVLEQHLMRVSVEEVRVAVENRFIPLMMVPEAAVFSSQHQTRGSIFPQTRERHAAAPAAPRGWAAAVLLPFRPIIGAYGGLSRTLERLRVGLVATLPDINHEVLTGVSGLIPGADWLIMRGFRTFGWGDRRGTVEALSVLPQHRLDQRLAEYVKGVKASRT